MELRCANYVLKSRFFFFNIIIINWHRFFIIFQRFATVRSRK